MTDEQIDIDPDTPENPYGDDEVVQDEEAAR